MKVNMKTFVLVTLSIMLLLPIIWLSAKWCFQNNTKQLYKEVINNNDYQEMYVYYLQNESIDQALYASNVKEGKELAQYYRVLKSYRSDVELGRIKRRKIYSQTINDSAYIDPIEFPYSPKYLVVGESVYAKSDDLSDTLIKCFVINKKCWSHIEVFLYHETVHHLSPSDSLIDMFNLRYKNISSNSNELFKKISPYNFYCN